MTTSLPSSPAAAQHWEPKYPFDLVVAYADLSTRNQAMRLHDQLTRQLQDDYDLQSSWWKFSLLDEPGLYERASDAAAEADMVILSVHAAHPLPERARSWMEDWAMRRDNHKGALVALVTGVEGRRAETQHLLTNLHQLARQARLDFFPHLDAETVATPLGAVSPADRASAITSTLLGILQHRSPAPRGFLHQP